MTLTEEALVMKYGATLSMQQLARELHYANAKSLLNAISAEQFPVPTFKLGKFRVAHASDVAAYIDAQRKGARI